MKYKKRKISVIIFLVLVITGAACQYTKETVGKNESDTAKIVFRFAEAMPKKHPSAMAADYFAALVEERSNGRIMIKVYYENKLGTIEEILEQLQFGGIAMAGVNALDLTETVTKLQNDFKYEMQGNAEDVLQWIEDNSEEIEDCCQMERVRPLAWYYPDIRCFYSDDYQIRTVSDLVDIKVGTKSQKIMKDTMQALKCEVVNIESADIHSSFITNYMDAGETTLSELRLSAYYRFIKYITVSDYINCPDVMLVSTEVYTKLEKEDRDLIVQAAKDTCDYQKKQMIDFKKQSLKKLIEEKDVFAEDKEWQEAINAMLKKEIGEEDD